jgi:hypothetical protein
MVDATLILTTDWIVNYVGRLEAKSSKCIALDLISDLAERRLAFWLENQAL